MADNRVEVDRVNNWRNATGARFTDEERKRVAQDVVLYLKVDDETYVPLRGDENGNLSIAFGDEQLSIDIGQVNLNTDQVEALLDAMDRGITQTPVCTVVEVEDEATPLPETPLSGRNRIRIRNADEQDVFMCDSQGNIGYTIEPNDSIIYDIKSATVLYAITESGTADVEVEEMK